MAFRLEAGKPIDVSVVLNAGVLALAAKDGKRIDVLLSKKDIYGERPLVATRYADKATLVVPVGSYDVKSTRTDGSERTVPAVVKAGERTEVSVE